MNNFLPVSREDMLSRGWDSVDFILITGDAYVDHPAFGTAIIGRVLEDAGYRVGIIAQPDWHKNDDFLVFGTPRLGIMVNAGNIDSMVAHYTAAKRRRNDDYYSPGGKAGYRPDRALIVYCNKCREIFGKTPIIIGGLEASLRRFAHYDYWQDEVRRSVLIDSGADILSFGMGEKQTREIAHILSSGAGVSALESVKGICYISDTAPEDCMVLPSYEEVKSDKIKYAQAARIELDEHDFISGHRLVQQHGTKYLVQNVPQPPLNTKELDHVYSLPFMRYYHPMYESLGGVPAIEEVEFSITHNRGCFGACNFCSLAFHQGRFITSRSADSVVNEAKSLVKKPRFKGYIHDVGGPTANFRFSACEKQKKSGLCKGKKCLAPTPCKNLVVDHSEYLAILRRLRDIKGVKSVFIRSGIRFDYLIEDKNESFFKELVEHHISGQLKVAPEHCSASVLDKMGKPHIESYLKFKKRYFELCNRAGLEQYLVPYLMSSHPGSTLNDAIELALFLKREHFRPKQVQDFYPTPGTISTAMYYTGIDPYTMKPVYVPKTMKEKAEQRALLQYFRPENRETVVKALIKAGRTDLIGHGEKYLVPPLAGMKQQNFDDAKGTKLKNKKRPDRNKVKKSSNKWEPRKKR